MNSRYFLFVNSRESTINQASAVIFFFILFRLNFEPYFDTVSMSKNDIEDKEEEGGWYGNHRIFSTSNHVDRV